MRNRFQSLTTLGGLFLILVLLVPQAFAERICPLPVEGRAVAPTSEVPMLSPASDTYNGRLRVNVVEPVSRWNNAAGEPYHFGFIGYAFNSNITLSEAGDFDSTWVWTNTSHPSPAISSGNIMVQAAVFNSTPHGTSPVYYWAEAAAAATPGVPDTNFREGSFTHTVFAEEGTATWCGYCPAVMAYLDTVYNDYYHQGTLPFYFTAMIDDMDTAAARRNDELGVTGFPTVWFDGGNSKLVGDYGYSAIYRTRINSAAQRAVYPLTLIVEVTYLGSNQLRIHVVVRRGPVNDQAPLVPGAPAGDDGAIENMSCTYTGVTTDPDADSVMYQFDCGGWLSPWTSQVASGQSGQISYVWPTAGTYSVKVKSKDKWDRQSDWSDPLMVTVGECGDANGSGGAPAVDIDDIVYLINFVFGGGPDPIPTLLAGDANCSGGGVPVDIDDIVFLINFVFGGGPAPCSTCP